MKDRNKLILAIVAVVLIAVVVVGATFAYWTWTTNEEQRTSVIFSADIPGLYASIEGNGTTTTTALKPAVCTHSTNAIQKEIVITYLNETVQSATVSATLQLTAFNLRSASYVPTTENLQHLHYALTTTSGSCDASIATDLEGNQITGTFADLTPTFSGTTMNNLPLTLFTQTFTADANMTAEDTQTYYLWIWLDTGYTHNNEGSENSDPMQGLTFTTQWSGQVAQNDPTA